MRKRRPKTAKMMCHHCKRIRASKFIEWHGGIEEWQCSNFSDCDDAIDKLKLRQAVGQHVVIDYTNWRGKRKERKIMPKSVRFAANKFHQTPQWLLLGFDLDTNEVREFAMKDIHSWRPSVKDPG